MLFPIEKCHGKTDCKAQLSASDTIAILTGRDACEELLVRRTNTPKKGDNWPLTVTSNEYLMFFYFVSIIQQQYIMCVFSSLIHLLAMDHLQTEGVADIKTK